MYFRQQKFLVAGISKSGSACCEFLLSRGAIVYMYDDVAAGAVQSTMAKLEERGAIPLRQGGFASAAEECDVLVLSPGIPIDHELPVLFRKKGKRILGEAELGCLFLRAALVAVTGTNGKTTTVTMIDEILRAAGEKSIACGNIGLPLVACVDGLGYDDIAVMEVSSFQLETLSSIRPHIAVITNVTEDHLDRHYTMENYIYLKSKLLRNMRESEFAVLNYDDPIVRGLAVAAGLRPDTIGPLSRPMPPSPPGDAVVVFDDLFAPARTGDLKAWEEALPKVLARWDDLLKLKSRFDRFLPIAFGRTASATLLPPESGLLSLFKRPNVQPEAWCVDDAEAA